MDVKVPTEAPTHLRAHFDPDVERAGPIQRSETAKLKPIYRKNSIILGGLTPSLNESGNDTHVQGREFRLESQIDTTRIIDSLCAHISFHVKEGYEMKNLPKFDDLARYSIRETEELELWKLEVRRLANSARSNILPTLEGDVEWFGKSDSEGYNRLNRLARQMLYGIDICVHDNELLLLEHHPQLANEERYILVHRRINGLFDEELGSIRYERPIRIEQFNDETLHELINYVTAVLIRQLE